MNELHQTSAASGEEKARRDHYYTLMSEDQNVRTDPFKTNLQTGYE